MTWKDKIKKDERFPDNERDWMEEDARTAFNVERHINDAIKGIVGGTHPFSSGLTSDLEDRLIQEADYDHISYTPIDDKEIRRLLLPIVEKIVKENFKFDMSKYRYSGP